MKGVFQALDTSEFGVTKQFPKATLDDVYDCLDDIMLELGFPEPDEDAIAALSECVMMEEKTHHAGTWESYNIKEDDGFIEAETFHRALQKWKGQV